MVGLKLASSTFTSGTSDVLAAADIYKTDAKNIINSIPISKQDFRDLFGSIKMSNGSLDVFGTIKGLSNTELGANLAAVAKNLNTSIRDLGSGVVGQATELISKVPINAQDLSCKIGDYTSKVDIKLLGQGAAIGAAIAGVGGKSPTAIASMAYNSGIFTGIIGQASDTGVAGAFTSMKDVISENGILIKVAKAASPFILKNTDVRLLNEITNSGIGRAFNDIVPGFTSAFSQVYNPRTNYSLSKIDSFDAVFRSFGELDSAWNKATQGDADIWSIAGILAGTNAFRNMVYTGVSYYISQTQEQQRKEELQSMALAQIYRKTTVKELIQRYFPNTPMIGNYDAKMPGEKSVDLRMVDKMARIFLT